MARMWRIVLITSVVAQLSLLLLPFSLFISPPPLFFLSKYKMNERSVVFERGGGWFGWK